MSNPPSPSTDPRYRALLEREERHWSAGPQDPANRQIWDDPRLFDLVLAGPYRRLIERAAAHGEVLELGSGDGDLALAIVEHGGARITGIDLSPDRVARARAEADRKGFGARATFEVGDLNTVTLPPERYDCVVAHDALHHVLALDHLLDTVRATLRPGGTLLVSDYVGVGNLEKLASALAFAVLPTYQPYRVKWNLRSRLKPFMASERAKRAALERGDMGALHDESPFEGISQESIERRIAERFTIVERFTFCPYWYHVLPKVRMPRGMRVALVSACQRLDRRLHEAGWTRGSYAYLEARR